MAMHPTEYAHPEALVETDWLEKHLNDAGIRIVESNEDILLYDTGHIPGAVHIDWRADLQDPLIRSDRLARETSQRRGNPYRRIERRYFALRHWAYPRCGAH